MSYKELLKRIAREHNTTPNAVEQEIQTAIAIAGYDIDPALFISLVASKIKNKLS